MRTKKLLTQEDCKNRLKAFYVQVLLFILIHNTMYTCCVVFKGSNLRSIVSQAGHILHVTVLVWVIFAKTFFKEQTTGNVRAVQKFNHYVWKCHHSILTANCKYDDINLAWKNKDNSSVCKDFGQQLAPFNSASKIVSMFQIWWL